MPSIQETGQKIKNWVEDAVGEWGIPIIVVLVGLASFGLGRLSAIEETQPVVSVRQAAAVEATGAIVLGGQVVASRSGKAYHYPWCAGAESISEKNKIWFKDEAAARKAGYTPAKNCKGLQ